MQFKSVFKFEDVGRTSYEADYFKVKHNNQFFQVENS